MKFAAEQSGSSLDAFSDGLRKQARFLTDARDGLSTATDTLDSLGLSLEDVEGLNPDELFSRFADAIASTEDPFLQSAAAQEIFGRGGTALLPLLQEGADGIRRLTDEARETGNVMSTEAAEGAANFTDAINKVKNIISGALLEGFSALVPVLEQVAVFLADNLPGAIRGTISAIETYVAIFRKIWFGSVGPLNIVIDIVKSIIAVIKGVIDVVGGIISGDWDRVWQGFLAIVEAYVNYALDLFNRFVNSLILFINLTIDGFNALGRCGQ